MEYHTFERNVFCTGSAFVPKEGGIEEDDGWIITFVHNEDTGISQVGQFMCKLIDRSNDPAKNHILASTLISLFF